MKKVLENTIRIISILLLGLAFVVGMVSLATNRRFVDLATSVLLLVVVFLLKLAADRLKNGRK